MPELLHSADVQTRSYRAHCLVENSLVNAGSLPEIVMWYLPVGVWNNSHRFLTADSIWKYRDFRIIRELALSIQSSPNLAATPEALLLQQLMFIIPIQMTKPYNKLSTRLIGAVLRLRRMLSGSTASPLLTPKAMKK